MQNVLRAKNKLGFIDGTLIKVEDDLERCQVWKKCNPMVISWIFNAFAPKLHNCIAFIDSTKDM